MTFLIRLTKYLSNENKLQLSITDRLNILGSAALRKTSPEFHLSFWLWNVRRDEYINIVRGLRVLALVTCPLFLSWNTARTLSTILGFLKVKQHLLSTQEFLINCLYIITSQTNLIVIKYVCTKYETSTQYRRRGRVVSARGAPRAGTCRTNSPDTISDADRYRDCC